jgi:hypothetical protein
MSDRMSRHPEKNSLPPPVFTPRRKWTLVVLLGLVAGLLVLGSFIWPGFANPGLDKQAPGVNTSVSANLLTGPLETATPGPGTVRQIASTLGDTLAGYDYLVTVDDTDHSDIFNDQLSASQDHTFLAFYVTMESRSDTGLEVNPRYWRLFDDQNPAYPEVYAGKDPALVSNKTLLKGQKLQGWVTFEIPKGARGFKLAYDIPNIPEMVSFVFDVG